MSFVRLSVLFFVLLIGTGVAVDAYIDEMRPRSHSVSYVASATALDPVSTPCSRCGGVVDGDDEACEADGHGDRSAQRPMACLCSLRASNREYGDPQAPPPSAAHPPVSGPDPLELR